MYSPLVEQIGKCIYDIVEVGSVFVLGKYKLPCQNLGGKAICLVIPKKRERQKRYQIISKSLLFLTWQIL